jgi:microcystin-dependent protein
MDEPFLGEIRIATFGFAPKGWAFCNGQLMSISQNQALFALLGTTYGGNGTTNFALPNLQGRVPIHVGDGITLGQAAGEAAHTLSSAEMPLHSHVPNASSNASDQSAPGGNFWGNAGLASYSTSAPQMPMSGSAIGASGGSQAHQNLSPYLTLTFMIALQGVFPTQN